MKRLSLIIVTVFLTSGCALTVWSQFKKAEYKDRPRKFMTEVPTDWMRFNMAKYFLMTRDGIALNYVRVDRIRFKDELEFTKKQFREDMLLSDILEVEIDNFNSSGEVSFFNLYENEPATVGGHGGYRIAYTYTTQGGLKKKGIQYGFKVEDAVYRIKYEAAEQNYYEKSADVFDTFVEHFQLTGEG